MTGRDIPKWRGRGRRIVASGEQEGLTAPISGPKVLERQPAIQLAPDQRVKERRAAPRGRAAPATMRGREGRHWFPARWGYLPAAMAGVIVAAAPFAGGLPSPLVVAMLVLSVAGVLSLHGMQGWLAGKGLAARLAVTAMVTLLPLFTFGMGITLWATYYDLPWDGALAAMLCVSGISAAYLRRQPAMIFVSQLAIWSAPVIAHASIAGMTGLVVAIISAVLVSREQLAELRLEDDKRQMQERMQTRARDILSDYEQTRQGWFWETDRRSLLTYVSQPVAIMLKAGAGGLIGRPLVDLFDLVDTGQEGERTLLFHLSARSAFQELPVRAAIAGEERWWSVSGRPVYDEFDNFVGFRGSGTDLTEQRRSQEHASRLAHYDSLTGLANRFQMSQALEKILSSPQAMNRACAVILLDLDRFKQINDTVGHPAGDALLTQVAQRLQRTVARMGQIGRLGGDEFKIIVPGRMEPPQLGELAADIIRALSQPFSIDGQQVVIGASVGIALAPDDGSTSEELIRNADLALYAAKDGGRGRYHFYAQNLHAAAEARAQMERELRDAIAQGDLQLFYQPTVSLAAETITGFEALLRWRHPTKGWIPPQSFVEIAEDSGLIAQIGEWAIRTACRDAAVWPEEVRVAVNVSPLQFANPQLPAIVTSAIAAAGIDPERLELEITESVFLNDSDGTDTMFAALKRVGVRLALDDFGTGYSSLGYLKKAPFDKIKIDRSFVRGATQPGSRNGAIIASITSLARTLGMETTAEGVETLDELELVRRHGCTHVQGFIYGRPIDHADTTARVAAGLEVEASGPKSARAPRQTMLRRVVLNHDGNLYNATIRNLSVTGALVEGLWHVPAGTTFELFLSDDIAVQAVARWSIEDRIGLEFATPLHRDQHGGIIELRAPPPRPVPAGPELRAG